MNKKIVVGGALAAILSALGLYTVGKQAADNSAQTPPAITEQAPVDPNAPPADPAATPVDPAATPAEEEESWYDWYLSLWGSDEKKEDSPGEIVRKSLGGH